MATALASNRSLKRLNLHEVGLDNESFNALAGRAVEMRVENGCKWVDFLIIFYFDQGRSKQHTYDKCKLIFVPMEWAGADCISFVVGVRMFDHSLGLAGPFSPSYEPLPHTSPVFFAR